MISTAKQKLALALVSGCTALATVPQAQAAATWNISSNSCQTAISNGGSGVGNSATCSATSGSGSVTMWAYGAGYVSSTNSATSTYQDANLAAMGGNGVAVKSAYEIATGTSSPQHAMDNSPTNAAPDLILLKFDTAVALDKISIGWRYNDADFTLMAYTGTFNAGWTTNDQKADGLVVGKTASTLNGGGTGTGWSLVENSGGIGYDPGSNASSDTDITRTVNAGNAAGGKKDIVSSWWVIAAYNTNFGGGTLDTYNDYIKLLSFASKDITPPSGGGKAPEPGSLALASLALLCLAYNRRRHS